VKFGKRFGLVAALVLTAAISAPVFAQDSSGCTLAAADCKILSTADSNISKETSFTQAFDFNVDVNTGSQKVNIKASGTGPFGVVANATDPLGGFQMQMDMTGSTTGTGSDSSGTINIIIVDGVLYLKGNVGSQKMDTWQGVKLSDLQSLAMSQMGAMTGGGAAGGSSALPGGVDPSKFTGLLNDPAVMTSLAAIPTIKGFITQEKTANSPDLDGQKQVEFVYTFSPKALLDSKEILPLAKALISAAASMGGASSGATAALTDDQVTQYLQLASGVLGDSNLKITRWVGSTDNMYHALGLDLNVNVAAGSSPITATVHLLVKLTKVGAPVTVKAPDGAKMINPAQMMGGAGAGSSPAMSATAAATAAQ